MSDYTFWLKKIGSNNSKIWRERQYRHGLICFFDALSLYLKAGYSLGYSWFETLRVMNPYLSLEVAHDLRGGSELFKEEGDVTDILKHLAVTCRIVPYRMWFSVVLKLYESGAQLIQGVDAVTTTLRREQERDFESHCRALPTKVNVILMLFFLPPTFLWLFVPLVLEIVSQFE